MVGWLVDCLATSRHHLGLPIGLDLVQLKAVRGWFRVRFRLAEILVWAGVGFVWGAFGSALEGYVFFLVCVEKEPGACSFFRSPFLNFLAKAAELGTAWVDLGSLPVCGSNRWESLVGSQ